MNPFKAFRKRRNNKNPDGLSAKDLQQILAHPVDLKDIKLDLGVLDNDTDADKRAAFADANGKSALLVEVTEELDLDAGSAGYVPISDIIIPLSSRPVMAKAEIPVAVVVALLLLRVLWGYIQRKTKVAPIVEQEVTIATESNDETTETNGNTASSSLAEKATSTSADETADADEDEAALVLKATLQKEAEAKQKLAVENQALQHALDSHKSTVDRFQTELNVRNDRLSVFEQEQETVRRDLSAQIEKLKSELQERQKQEQGNLTSKEALCNDLISKIQMLNADLENHEKLWQGVTQKANQKEAEATAKVETLQQTLHQEQVQRAKELALKEDEVAELAAKVKTLASQKQKQAAQQEAFTRVTQTSNSTAVDLQQRLSKEHEHASKLTSKLEMFKAELTSRQSKVASLNAKMNDFEKLSRTELKALQRELDGQVQQRSKLEKTAEEMTRLLQERRDQCDRLSMELDSSKAELKAVEQRVTVLSSEVEKREKMANSRLDALQQQLNDEKEQFAECQETTSKTSNELTKKQEEFVQLTARMDLHLKELQFREEQVSSLENKMTYMEELATDDMKALRAKLAERQKLRDDWNKPTEDLAQMLRDKKAQVVGLTTRADLFERELKGRQERVATLEAKIKERQDVETVQMEPYRNELQRLKNECDSWKAKTDEISSLLTEKKGQTEGLQTRLNLFRSELSKKSERVAFLKAQVQEKEQKTNAEMAPTKEKLETQREERDAWASKTEAINKTLNEKRAQCIGLKTRKELFKKELESKEKDVARLETRVADRQEIGGSDLESLKKHVNVQTMALDEWQMNTKKVARLLVEKEKEAADLTVQIKKLVTGLQKYQQQRASLEAKTKERKSNANIAKAKLEEDLKALEGHRDEWKVKVDDLYKAMQNNEHSIVGLETRSMLFQQELEERNKMVEKLQKEYDDIENLTASRTKDLLQELSTLDKQHEEGVEMTLELNKALKVLKRECVGLTTRAKLFAQELEKRDQLVSVQRVKISDAEAEAADALERFQSALAKKTKERDDWKAKTDEITRLKQQTEGEIAGLGTRLDLFMSQVMEYEEQVANAETRLQNRGSFQSSESLMKEFEAAKKQRDEWTTKAINIERTLRERKAQVPGLQTRKSLFAVELSKFDEQVAILKSKLDQKKQASDAKISPLKNALQVHIQQRDDWKSKVEEIDQILIKKQEECLPIAENLETCIDDLTRCKNMIDTLKNERRKDEESGHLTKAKTRLEAQQKELQQWEISTAKVTELLREKKQGVEGFKTRKIVFEGELQKRTAAVKDVQDRISDVEQALEEDLRDFNFQIEVAHQERDRIIEAILAGNQELKKTEETCNGLKVRQKLFDDELRQRKDRVTKLSANLKEKEFDFAAQMKSLNQELAEKRADRDKWRDSTQSIVKLLNDTEGECTGLSTRSQLFMAELKNYDEIVAKLEAHVDSKEGESTEEMAFLRSKLQEEQDDHDNWDKKTSEIASKLNDTKGQIVGLNTRSTLFQQELATKNTGVAALEAKIGEKDQAFSERIEPLMKEYTFAKADTDGWEKSTRTVEQLLVKAKNEVASIPTRLDLFRKELQTRQNAVEMLDAKIKNKEDLVAIQLGFLLNELKLQQKHRGKWKKVTIEMHRLLKETKEQVANLTTEFDTAKADLKTRQDRIADLETSLRDGRDMVAQQLKTVRNEIEHQRDQRDKLSQTCTTLKRHLEEAKKQCVLLSQKLEESESKAQASTVDIEKLQVKVDEKKKHDAAQIDSIKDQVKVHLEQQTEWEQNTKYLNEQLKEKQTLCATAKAKLALLKKMQNDEEITSCLVGQASSIGLSALNGGISNTLASKGRPEGAEKEQKIASSDSADQLKCALKEKENQQTHLNSKMEVLTNELMNL